MRHLEGLLSPLLCDWMIWLWQGAVGDLQDLTMTPYIDHNIPTARGKQDFPRGTGQSWAGPCEHI